MTAQSRRDRPRWDLTTRPAHPLPGPEPRLRAPVRDRSRPAPLLAAGWVLFVAGLAAVAAGLAGAPVGVLVAGIALIALAGAAATVDPPEGAGPTARRLKALLLSGLTQRGPV